MVVFEHCLCHSVKVRFSYSWFEFGSYYSAFADFDRDDGLFTHHQAGRVWLISDVISELSVACSSGCNSSRIVAADATVRNYRNLKACL